MGQLKDSVVTGHSPMYQQARVLRKIAARRHWNDAAFRRGGTPAVLTGRPGTGERICVTSQPAGASVLTRREMEVLRLVARGETDRGIAERLYLSHRTVSSHVSNILAKLDVPSRKVAVLAAARVGLL